MIPFVLPNVLVIAEDCTQDEYEKLILPQIKPVFKIQEPIQVGCMYCVHELVYIRVAGCYSLTGKDVLVLYMVYDIYGMILYEILPHHLLSYMSYLLAYFDLPACT